MCIRDRPRLLDHARDSIAHADGGVDDPDALDRFLSLLNYIDGDYGDPATFAALRDALAGARHPAHYLAIPPSLFATVIAGLGAAELASDGRVIVEKPFGRDLASARELNRVVRSVFAEDAIFRIDHFLGKEEIMNLLYFRFAHSFLEPIWNRNHLASVHITLGEQFGDGGLDAGDVVAVPDRFQERVREPEVQQVHDLFLAEEVIDAEDRVLREDRTHDAVQLTGRGEIAPERLLHDDPPVTGQLRCAESRDHRRE